MASVGGFISLLLYACWRVPSTRKKNYSHIASANWRASEITIQVVCVDGSNQVVVELATRLDSLRNIEGYRPYQRSILALETMQLYAPMAHALRVEGVREELEDRAFEVRHFPRLQASCERRVEREWEFRGSGLLQAAEA